MTVGLNFEFAPIEGLVLSNALYVNASPSSSVGYVKFTDWVGDLCNRIHDFAMGLIQSFKNCFGCGHSTAPLNSASINVQGPLNLIPFYRGLESNNRGVTVDQILNWNDDQLELVHTYIQWLFPVKTPSNYNLSAPILDNSTIQTFHADQALKNRVLRSFRRMLSFYGLQMNETSKVISRAPNYSARAAVWLLNPLDPGHHNFLRITRIIQSMNFLGLSDYSTSFFNIMRDIRNNEGHAIIGADTFQFWTDAAAPVS